MIVKTVEPLKVKNIKPKTEERQTSRKISFMKLLTLTKSKTCNKKKNK